jgi:hypothetical protein
MIVDDIFIANLDQGDSKFILKVKDNPKIWGVIEKEYSKNRTKEIYTIKYYWNNVFQDEKYADNIEEAKEKLKTILKQVIEQTTQKTLEKRMKTKFDEFLNEGAKDGRDAYRIVSSFLAKKRDINSVDDAMNKYGDELEKKLGSYSDALYIIVDAFFDIEKYVEDGEPMDSFYREIENSI